MIWFTTFSSNRRCIYKRDVLILTTKQTDGTVRKITESATGMMASQEAWSGPIRSLCHWRLEAQRKSDLPEVTHQTSCGLVLESRTLAPSHVFRSTHDIQVTKLIVSCERTNQKAPWKSYNWGCYLWKTSAVRSQFAWMNEWMEIVSFSEFSKNSGRMQKQFRTQDTVFTGSCVWYGFGFLFFFFS